MSANEPVRQFDVGRPRVRIERRFVPVFGGYAPYYVPTLPQAVANEQAAAAPLLVETETPVNVNIAMRADHFTALPLCSGPRIIELVEPEKTHIRRPRVIYGTPLSCIAARVDRRGPGIYYFD